MLSMLCVCANDSFIIHHHLTLYLLIIIIIHSLLKCEWLTLSARWTMWNSDTKWKSSYKLLESPHQHHVIVLFFIFFFFLACTNLRSSWFFWMSDCSQRPARYKINDRHSAYVSSTEHNRMFADDIAFDLAARCMFRLIFIEYHLELSS